MVLSSDATVKGGTLTIAGNTPFTVTGNLNVNDGTNMTFAPGATRLTHQVGSLSINGSAANVDLNNHELLTSTDPGTIKSYLAQAFDAAGNQDWAQKGLTSSVAKANPVSFSVGYAFGGD